MSGINAAPINSFPINGTGDGGSSTDLINWIGADFGFGGVWSFNGLYPPGGNEIVVPPLDTAMKVCYSRAAYRMRIPCIDRVMVVPRDCTHRVTHEMRIPCINRTMKVPGTDRTMVVPAVDEGCD